MSKEKVYIYKGKGVSKPSLDQTLEALELALGEGASLSTLTIGQLKEGGWRTDASLFILPGGRDLPYLEQFEGEGNALLNGWVKEGGSFLGLCAGAYYASAAIEFEMGTPLEVAGKRPLAFFPGKATGPAYGNGRFSYQSESGAEAAKIECPGGPLYAYFNGGCTFHGLEKFPAISTLASYSDIAGRPPAIIECPVGKGLAILSGVHLEFSAAAAPHPLRGKISLTERARRLLFKGLLERLLHYRMMSSDICPSAS